jgi:hypothetical protein
VLLDILRFRGLVDGFRVLPGVGQALEERNGQGGGNAVEQAGSGRVLGGNIESTRSSVRFTFSRVSAVLTEVGKLYFVTAPGRRSAPVIRRERTL